MNGWAGFWLMLAILGSVQMIVDYLYWKTKIEYGIKKKESFKAIKKLFKKKK